MTAIPAEYGANIETFVSTLVVQHPRLGRVRMNASDYVAERDGGEIVEGPTIRPNTPDLPVAPNKDPKLDADGNAIAEQASPMHRA